MEINAYMNRGGGEQYVAPQMEIVDLSSENAILTSCGGCGFADMDGYSIPVCTGDSGCPSDTCMMNLW